MFIVRWEKVCRLASAVVLAATVGTASAEVQKAKKTTSEPDAVPKVVGNSAPNALAGGLIESPVAQGSQPLEGGTSDIPFYGYHGDGPMLPAPGDVQAPGHNVEATKSEPDKNTYLVLHNQSGPDPDYDYGRHFLFQGHELGLGYITRVNLDADAAHRVTLWATEDSNHNPLPEFDGSTWDPWAQRLLFTAELGADGGVWQSTLDFPPTVEDVSGVLGRGGYEGIQNDSDGNLWIAEDVSGARGTVNNHARQPNSFLFRFLPKDKHDLTKGGKLQALQVCRLNITPCDPIVFHANDVDGDILSQNQANLHTYGNQFKTNWITVHDTDTDGMTPFDANALAKTKLATPFKRPENGQFRPGKQFKEFFFDATGDTDAATQAGSQYGGFGAIFKLTQSSPSANSGVLTLFYRGDIDHTALDNVAFWDKNHVVFVEDRGDGLHAAHNAFDSGWLFDVHTDYSDPDNQPFRLLALGRDASATIDSAILGIPDNDFQNDGDNEITGIHVSDGNPGIHGILGAQNPHPFRDGWRVFYTQQHGDNVTWEVLSSGSGSGWLHGEGDGD